MPVGILAIILINLGLKNKKVKAPINLDLTGICFMVFGIISLLLLLTLGGKDYAWISWQILALGVSALVFIISFIINQKNSAEPILPMDLFKNKTFNLLNGIGFLMSIGMFGAIMFVPLFMQGVMGMSSSESGTMMTPMVVSLILASIIGGRLVKHIAIKTQIISGFIIMLLGFFSLSTMDLHTSKIKAMLFMSLLGFGIGLVMPLITLAIQQSFPKSQLAIVTSSSQFFRQIGGTFGITILGTVMNHYSTNILTQKLVPVLEKITFTIFAISSSI